MLTLLAMMSARADEEADTVPNLDALITISVTPIIQHPLIEVEPQTDSEEFRDVLRRRQGQIVYCFETSLKNNPSLTGNLTLVVDIKEGVVQSVITPTNTVSDKQIGQCVSAKVRSWRFPASLTDEFTLPFICGASSD